MIGLRSCFLISGLSTLVPGGLNKVVLVRILEQIFSPWAADNQVLKKDPTPPFPEIGKTVFLVKIRLFFQIV